MALFKVTYTFVANTKARSSEVNQNFTDVINILKAHHHDPNLYTDASPLTNSGIAANAQILATQLKYPITLSGLVNYLALDNVPVEKGGVGMARVTAGDLIVGIAGNKYKTLALGGVKQFLRVNVAGNDLEYVDTPANNYGEVNAGENLAQYNPVWINPSDCLAYISHGFKSINSASWTGTATLIGRVAKLSDSQFIYLYHNGGTTLSVAVATRSTGVDVDTETVTTAFDQTTPSTSTLPMATVCRLTDTTFVVIYARTTDNFLYFRTGSISGSTITMDTETAYPGSPDFCSGFNSVPAGANGKVALIYFDSTTIVGNGGTVTPKLSYLTVTTNSITVTTTVSASTVGSSPYNATETWTAITFTKGIAYGMFCIANSGGIRGIKYSYINTNNSSTGADIQTVNLEAETGSGVSSLYSAFVPSLVGHNGKAYFGWATFDGGTGINVNTKTVLEINQVGCKITYQTTALVTAGDTTVSALPMAGNECGVIATKFPSNNYAGGDLANTIYIQCDKIYTFYSLYDLTSSNQLDANLWYSNLKDEIVIFNDGTFIKTWRLPTPVDGIVGSAVTAGQPAALSINTITMSGLTANAGYFLKDTYSAVGDLDFNGTIPVGQALTTTLMRFRS